MTPRRPLRRALSALVAITLLCSSASSAWAIGLMIPNDRGERPFDVESHRVQVTINNTAAVTTIEQVFKNQTNRPLEATFVFPIPEGATVSDFSLWIEGEKTKGAVLEKDEARAIYESIVRRVEDPGLIEYIDGKIFQASIFPIPAGGTQKMEIKFGQVLQKRGGLYRYHYPLSVGGEYVTAKTEKDFTLSVKASGPVPITTLYSPTHAISTHRESDREVTLGTEEMYASLDRDFELYVGHSEQDIGLSLLTHDPDGDGGEEGYFMLALAPGIENEAHDEIGQTFTFVMDTSGSMAGEKIEQAKKTLKFCLERLRPQDTFNVVLFSTVVEKLFDDPVSADRVNIRQGLEFVRDLKPAGGTAIGPAVETVFEQTTRADQPHQVIFVTDGIPTIGQIEASDILEILRSERETHKARLFTFGVGFDVNAPLLDGMASETRGRSDYIKPGEALEEAVAALYARISAPVLTDIELDLGQARVYDMYPSPIPDLFKGDQIVLFGRYRQGFGSSIRVTGQLGGEQREYKFGEDEEEASGSATAGREGGASAAAPWLDETYSEPLEFLPKLWATRKVGFLLAQIRMNGDQEELKTEVIRLAKKFGLVTPYTSYLAVDDSELERAAPPRSDGVMTFQGGGERGGGGGMAKPRTISSGKKVKVKSSLSSGKKVKMSKGKGVQPRPDIDIAARGAKRREAFAESFGGFSEAVGEESVAASEATREYKESEQVRDESGSTRRWIAGKTFDLNEEGVWVEEGVEDIAAAHIERVEAYSGRYFELLRAHRELGKFLKLGERLVVRLEGETYRFVEADTSGE